MEIPTYLLFVLGCLGAADIVLYHSVSHGIRSHPDSVAELLTHSLRGPTYAALFLVIPNFELHGLLAWALMALLLFDVGISVCDFALEQNSRRLLGGLPGGEYILHMLMAMVFGALVTTLLAAGHGWLGAPTRLVYAPCGVPSALRAALAFMAMLVLASGVQDALAAVRLKRMVSGEHRPFPNEGAGAAEGRETTWARAEVWGKADNSTAKRRVEPGWMKPVLMAAAVYNVLWGAWVVLFPRAVLDWVGIPSNSAAPFWQCIGMIVGVYGLGYWIAAREPARHWPIVLVGLLGKVLGPIGMGWAVAHQTMPARMAWVCVANDLVWWLPFGLILVQVMAKAHAAQLSPPERRIKSATVSHSPCRASQTGNTHY